MQGLLCLWVFCIIFLVVVVAETSHSDYRRQLNHKIETLAEKRAMYATCEASILNAFKDVSWFDSHPQISGQIGTKCDSLIYAINNKLGPEMIEAYCDELFLSFLECYQLSHSDMLIAVKEKQVCIESGRQAYLRMRSKLEISNIC
jgi:hypothetical protein